MTGAQISAAPVFGYLRLSLLRRPRCEVEDGIERVAAQVGGRVRRVFVEPLPAVDLLWSLVIGADRSSGGRVMPAVTAVAQRRGVDVPRVLAAGRRRTIAVGWRALMSELRVGGGIVIVPELAHLDGLAASRSVLLQELSRMKPSARVLSVSDRTSPWGPVPAVVRTVALFGVLGEFGLHAFAAQEQIASSKVYWYLSRAGLAYLAADAVAVLGYLIEARVWAEVPDGRDEIRVRLSRTAGVLVIEVQDSREYTGEPVPAGVRQRCSSAVRHGAVGGGTTTWCELPLAEPDPARRAASPTVRGEGR